MSSSGCFGESDATRLVGWASYVRGFGAQNMNSNFEGMFRDLVLFLWHVQDIDAR